MVTQQLIVDWAHLMLLTAAVGFLLHEVGLLSLGHAGLLLGGAYATAFVALGMVSPLMGALVMGLPLILIAAIAAKVRDDIFAVVTLALAETMRLFVLGADKVTQGALGLGPVPRISVMSDGASAGLLGWSAVALALAMAIITLRSWPGLVLGTIRDGELFARGIGINTKAARSVAVMCSGSAALGAGLLQVEYFGVATPTMGNLDVSLQAIAAAMLAWPFWKQGQPLRTAAGFALGAAIVTMLPPLLRLLSPATADAAVLRQALLGVLLFSLVHPRSPLNRCFSG
jgi:ABC-type branched-subunit amino acid transport system permease subunit